MVYKVPNERQAALCRSIHLDPDEVGVDAEDADRLRLKHYKSGNFVTIHKEEKQRRIEKEMKLW